MKFRIGVDFDNTIACYDHVFAHAAVAHGLLLDSEIASKADVKSGVLSRPGGDLNWQKLQGQIYGKFMHKASIFPGFVEFLSLARIRGHEVYIVSHKTEFGHFDEEKVSLPDEAMKWLIANKFVGPKPSMVRTNHVFFEPTRELKLARIQTLGCTHFIDDLEEVLNEPGFADTVRKYLFNYNAGQDFVNLQYQSGSWRAITKQILGDWTEGDIYAVIQDIFPQLQVQKVELTKGRGNSKIYKLYAQQDQAYALKIYPDLQKDNRKRLKTEFCACQILNEAGLPVVQAVAKNDELNWAIYSWVDGVIETPDEQFIDKSITFINQLIKFSHISKKVEIFHEASEACLNGAEIVKQVQRRLDRLKQADNTQISNFLLIEFQPTFQKAIDYARQLMGAQFDILLNKDLLIVSPSDFGAHNAIKSIEGTTRFIDFEYFGWDDPVKLACDFYWHPAMNLDWVSKTIWMEKIKAIFVRDAGFEIRMSAYLPLFGLRWCLILLNEFLPDKLAQRIHADHEKKNEIAAAQEMQFNKSKNILELIKITLNHG